MKPDNQPESVSGMAHNCTASVGVNKFMQAGQAFLQDPTGRHPLILTTVLCQVCGYVGVSTVQMNLPVPVGLSMPGKPETGVKPVRQ